MKHDIEQFRALSRPLSQVLQRVHGGRFIKENDRKLPVLAGGKRWVYDEKTYLKSSQDVLAAERRQQEVMPCPAATIACDVSGAFSRVNSPIPPLIGYTFSNHLQMIRPLEPSWE